MSQLESNGELVRISVPVDPLLEIAAITDRICKQPDGGPALLFEQPSGACFPVATNLFGSLARVCRALGVDSLQELAVRLERLLEPVNDFSLSGLDHRITALPEFSRHAADVSAESDPGLIEMEPPDLAHFPFLQNWPDDGSETGHPRYITLPQVYTTALDGGSPNCGLYRIQIRGARELAIQWKAGSGAARHAEEYRRNNQAMPVAIALGGDPATLFSAMFPLPGNLDELTFAGFLRGCPVRTAPCSTVPLRVPIGAEVVIEGWLQPAETVMEGPFGNHTGFYSPAAAAVVMQVSAIRNRPDAVIPATVVGPPPMEDCWMARAWERLLLVLLRKLVPAVDDIHFPMEWIFHQSAIISLEKTRPGMVRNISGQLWALPWFAASRILIFVEAGAVPLNSSFAAWKCINLTEFGGGIIQDTTSGRIAIDATGHDSTRRAVSLPPGLADRIDRRWREYGF